MMSLTHRFIWTTLTGCLTLLIIGLALPQVSDAAVYKWWEENEKFLIWSESSKKLIVNLKAKTKKVPSQKPLERRLRQSGIGT